jgi:GT2 family glycosyltransferase
VELIGSLIGLRRYQQAQRAAEKIITQFGPTTPVIQRPLQTRASISEEEPIAVRTIDLSQSGIGLPDVTDYMRVRIFITWADLPIGSFEIINGYRPLSAARLRDAAVDHLGLKLLGADKYQGSLWTELVAALSQRYLPAEPEPNPTAPAPLPVSVSVSVVVATHDRPGDLRECLQGLASQISPRKIEVIIVDNNPASGLTPPVVAEFPGVVLINETRKGLSYARNRGIALSQGEIIIATDDDVKVPPTWLERLVAPFSRADVMVVTGNTLPFELETSAQQLFERYGGLGRGFERFEVGTEWFESYRHHAVPTWELGATANAAFRATIFSDPKVGLLDETLGVGTPTGCSEDTYLFYKVLKAGYTLMYEPTAYLWHKHRRDKSALHRQIHGYSKGHVAYHLTTLLRDQDMRALFHIGFHMPRWHMQRLFWQLKNRLQGRKNEYPIWMTMTEIKGNLAGPWALWRSRRRVAREGLSQPYVPVAQRSLTPLEPSFEPGPVNFSLASEKVL